jgi:hypothetical protein
VFDPWPDDERSELLGYLYQTLGVDDEWALIRPNGFDWWAQPLRQRVTVSDITQYDDTGLFRCVVETDVAVVPSPGAEAINLLNRLASFSACVRKPTGMMTLASSYVCHAQFLPHLRSTIALTMGLQQQEAMKAAFLLAQAKGAEIATSKGPSGEERLQADEMVSGPAQLVVAKASMPLPDESDWERIKNMFNARGFLSFHSAEGVSCEVPFGCATALIVIKQNEHPAYGAGVLMRLHLPAEGRVRLGDSGTVVDMPTALNLANTSLGVSSTATHAVGGWCRDADTSSVVNAVFVPAMNASATTITGLGLSLGNKASNLARDVGTVLTGPGEVRFGMERIGEPAREPFRGILESSGSEELGASIS